MEAMMMAAGYFGLFVIGGLTAIIIIRNITGD